jgi:hypothetical protein
MQSFWEYENSILDQGRADALDLNSVSLNATTESSMKLLVQYAEETLAEFNAASNPNCIQIKERLDIVIPKMFDLKNKYWKDKRGSIGPLQQWAEWKDYTKPLYKILNYTIREIKDHLEVEED